MTDNQHPTEAFIVGDDGLPIGHVDFDRLTTDATLLMYALAETAGDDAATDRVATEWSNNNAPAYFGYLCAAALSLTIRNVLAPVLEVTDQLGIDLRTGLKRCAADARRDLGAAQ